MTLSEVGVLVAAIAVIGMIYPHVLYPLILRVIALIRTKPIVLDPSYRPTVDVCISAYNEEQYIDKCIASILATDIEPSKLRILIGDDGSTDATIARIENVRALHSDSNIQLISFKRQGKNAVMNELVAIANADVVVFTDADTLFHRKAISELIKPLADDHVGASVGCLVGLGEQGELDVGAHGEASYRALDRITNITESAISSTVTSNGALYAVKRSLLKRLTNSRVADDWAHLLSVMATRKRVVLVPHANAHELRSVEFAQEIRRTIRTASSGMATVRQFASLLLPSAGLVSYFLLSHKIIRWFSPVFLIMLMVGTVMTVELTSVFGWLFYLQLALYSAALIAYAGLIQGQRVPLASVCLYFVAMNAAFAVAIGRFVSGKKLDAWDPSSSVML